MKLLALLLLAACGTNSLPDTNPAPAANVRRVARVAALMRDDWEHSGWAVVNDPYFGWPVLLAIATNGSACVIPGPLWAVLKRGDGVACETAWRVRR
jgi:hypothetical protein